MFIAVNKLNKVQYLTVVLFGLPNNNLFINATLTFLLKFKKAFRWNKNVAPVLAIFSPGVIEDFIRKIT